MTDAESDASLLAFCSDSRTVMTRIGPNPSLGKGDTGLTFTRVTDAPPPHFSMDFIVRGGLSFQERQLRIQRISEKTGRSILAIRQALGE